jgi:sugar transferase EpsL
MSRIIKRLVDFIVAAVGLSLLGPVLAIVAALVLISMGRPVFFRQIRPGLHGRPFKIVKFRTMTMATGADGKLLPDEQRLTSVGRMLRRFSLDEIPQLWNVLTGDMSLVGPRPLLIQYLERYTPEQARRHEVPPGITGWTQVNGRNALTWEQKFALDTWYVDHWNLCLDGRILAVTIRKVITGEGLARQGYETMPEFMGNEEPKS